VPVAAVQPKATAGYAASALRERCRTTSAPVGRSVTVDSVRRSVASMRPCITQCGCVRTDALLVRGMACRYKGCVVPCDAGRQGLRWRQHARRPRLRGRHSGNVAACRNTKHQDDARSHRCDLIPEEIGAPSAEARTAMHGEPPRCRAVLEPDENVGEKELLTGDTRLIEDFV
jgi:hypothetical protein